MATESMFDAPSLWWVIGTSEIHFLLLPSALHQQCCKECCLIQHGSSMTELLRHFLSWRKLLSPIFVCLLCFVFSFISCSGRFDFVFTVWTFLLELDPAVCWYTNLTASGPKLCSGSKSPSLASTTHQVRGSRELAMVEEQRRLCRLLPGPMAWSKMLTQLLSPFSMHLSPERAQRFLENPESLVHISVCWEHSSAPHPFTLHSPIYLPFFLTPVASFLIPGGKHVLVLLHRYKQYQPLLSPLSHLKFPCPQYPPNPAFCWYALISLTFLSCYLARVCPPSLCPGPLHLV